jgi:hypothetical protein
VDPLSLLELSLAALESGEPLPPEARRWLIDGLGGWLAGVPLEEALELNRLERNTRLKADRNRHLRQAWRLLEDMGGTPWARSVRLKAEIERFESVLWPGWRDLPALPAGASELRTALFHAFKARRPPRTEVALHKICHALSL